MTSEKAEFDEAMAEVRRRVDEGRRSGKYPEELDEQLASEFARLAKDPLAFGRLDALRSTVEKLRRASFGRALIEYSSSVPGGSALHQLVGKLVSRQVLSITQQTAAFAAEVSRSLDAVVAALEEIQTVVTGDVLGDIDAVHHRLVRVERRLARLEDDRGDLGTSSASGTGVAD